MLRNIIHIATIPCHELEGMVMLPSGGVSLPREAAFTAVEGVKYPAKLVVTEKVTDKRSLFTAQLTMMVCADGTPSLERKAFVCEAADGTRYLLGGPGRPYPIAVCQETHPDKYSDSQLIEVQVTLTTTARMPQIAGVK